jgi:AcrR family transcriptional regulator
MRPDGMARVSRPSPLRRLPPLAAVQAGPRSDRFVAAAARWIRGGRRLDMQGLAEELGVSRATLFRRVGSREELLGQALWLLTERTLVTAARRWEAERPAGALHTPGTGRHINAIVSQSPGLRRLLDDEPALTLRVLTDPRGRVQTGMAAFVSELLRRDMAEFGLVPLTEPDALAYALVRLGESFLYADALAARQPDVATANRLQRALVEGIRPDRKSLPPGRPGELARAAPEATGRDARGRYPGAPGAGAPSDGRAARSHRTRRAIVDAMRALHAEGDLRPTAPRIADRAGVSLRTVWQQFSDMEALLLEAIRRDDEILRSLIERIDPDQPLADRVALFTGERSRILAQMSPTWRAARMHKPVSEHLRRNKARTLALAKAEIEAVFASELTQLTGDERQHLTDSLHAVSIWSFWESLRTDLGLEPEPARELLGSTVNALLAGAGFR